MGFFVSFLECLQTCGIRFINFDISVFFRKLKMTSEEIASLTLVCCLFLADSTAPQGLLSSQTLLQGR